MTDRGAGRDWRRRRPPRATLDWAVRAVGPGARVVDVRPLGRGGWLATHAVTVEHERRRHRLVLRRWARPGWHAEDPTFPPENEARVLVRLEALAPTLPVPRLVAVDAAGAETDVPAILATRVPGRPPSYAATRRPAALGQLADALAGIHRLDGLEGEVPPYRSYSSLDVVEPPPASRRPELWRRALGVASGPPPAARATFIHRDYHPANTLWVAGLLTGIVDWTTASWGPPAADVAHLRANLGIGHEPAVADLAEQLYRSAGGTTDDQRWWDLRTTLDYLPDLGAHLAAGEGLDRLERWVGHLLDEL